MEDKKFKRKRYSIGEAIPDDELIRRLAYQLQIPQRYGKRILAAYREVTKEALENGEGFNLGIGNLKVIQYNQRDYPRGLYKGQKRQSMYYYHVAPSPSGREILIDLTYKNFLERELKGETVDI